MSDLLMAGMGLSFLFLLLYAFAMGEDDPPELPSGSLDL